jgi:acetoin utilization deacetylase AcuC-like enzyme
LHGQDDYPFYWGNEIETGQGPGLGYNVNVPLPVGTKDEEYLAALDKTIKEHILPYGADYLVVSLGVDTYSGDPVGMFDISQDCFYKIGQLIQSIGLPCLILMEGGYDIQELGTNVVNFLKAFH